MLRFLALALLCSSALAQESQQRFVPSASAQQYDEADELALREYVDVRIDALDRSVQTALTSAKEAVLKAEAATDSRFQSVNEFRGSLNDLSRVQMPRAESEQASKALSDRLDRLSTQVADMQSRSAGAGQLWPILFGVVGVIGILSSMYTAYSRKPVR